MANENRKSWKPGRAGAIAALLLLAAAGLAAESAIGDRDPVDPGDRRRQVVRENLIRSMDIFAVNYGAADWSPVVTSLLANPSDPGNAAVMTAPLSLANVYLNRFEIGGDRDNLERSVGLAEWVAWNGWLWGGREGSGSIAAYLDLTVRRLRAECDISGFEVRIEALRLVAIEIRGEEGTGRLSQETSSGPSFGYETGGPVERVEPGETLAAAIQDSRFVEFLAERLLTWFPAGSQCRIGQ